MNLANLQGLFPIVFHTWHHGCSHHLVFTGGGYGVRDLSPKSHHSRSVENWGLGRIFYKWYMKPCDLWHGINAWTKVGGSTKLSNVIIDAVVQQGHGLPWASAQGCHVETRFEGKKGRKKHSKTWVKSKEKMLIPYIIQAFHLSPSLSLYTLMWCTVHD